MTESDPTAAHDQVAEQYVIGAALTSYRWASELAAIVAPDAFYLPQNGIVWESIRRTLDGGGAYDAAVVAQRLADAGMLARLPGGAVYLADCQRAAIIAENAPHHARRVAGLAHKRAVALRLLQAQRRLAEVDPESVSTAVDAAVSDLANVATNMAGIQARIVAGGRFLLDVPDVPPALWGDGREILWARGEALVIAGPQGVGKTTLAGQLLRGALGLSKSVLGYPVQPCVNRVLYLAMDRPQQAQRCLGRMFREEERGFLDETLAFWPGPPLADVAAHPETLLAMARQAGADVVFVDSIKDAAVGLAQDEVGAGYNRARQMLTADGRQVVELHHTVKGSADQPPKSINGVYGSTWITSGAGSVVMLWGETGDPIVEFRQLKKPMEEVGPFRLKHNSDTGLIEIWHDEDTDVVALARRCKTTGLTAVEAALCLYRDEIRGDKPTPAQRERARRALERYVAKGLLVERAEEGGRGTSRWFAAASEGWSGAER